MWTTTTTKKVKATGFPSMRRYCWCWLAFFSHPTMRIKFGISLQSLHDIRAMCIRFCITTSKRKTHNREKMQSKNGRSLVVLSEDIGNPLLCSLDLLCSGWLGKKRSETRTKKKNEHRQYCVWARDEDEKEWIICKISYRRNSTSILIHSIGFIWFLWMKKKQERWSVIEILFGCKKTVVEEKEEKEAGNGNLTGTQIAFFRSLNLHSACSLLESRVIIPCDHQLSQSDSIVFLWLCSAPRKTFLPSGCKWFGQTRALGKADLERKKMWACIPHMMNRQIALKHQRTALCCVGSRRQCYDVKKEIVNFPPNSFLTF